MSNRYDVIGPDTLEAIRRDAELSLEAIRRDAELSLEAIRRDAELSRLKDRIAKLEAALRKFANCVCESNCDEKSGQVCQLWACRKALEGKDE